MRRITILLAVLAASFTAILVAPAIASAGCQVQPGSVTATTSIQTYSYVSCTSNNGSHYQLRMYIQANSGGWHSVSTGISWDIYNPPTNYLQRFNGGYGCAMFAQADTQARNKSVLENMVTHTTDIGYGPAANLPSSCF